MDRPLRIALLSRRYSILSRRIDLLDAHDPLERYVRLYPGLAPRTLTDKKMIMEVGETDRLCARAVLMLNRKGCRRAEVVELMSELDTDRIIAVVYALPWSAKQRRDFLLSQPEWYRAVEVVKAEMGEALLDAEWLTRMEAELLRAVMEQRDPMEVVPERIQPLVSNELRDHLAEMAELVQAS